MTTVPFRGPRTSRRAVTRSLCTIVLLVTVSSNSVPAQELLPPPTQNALAGSQLFGAKGCVNCHAIRGLGGTEAPDLAGLPRPRSFYDLAAAMWNHLPTMVPRMRQLGIDRPQLTPSEIGDLIAFLFTLDYFDPAGDGSAGARLFTEKRCVQCHQVRGVGGVTGPELGPWGGYVAPIQFATAMWNHAPAMSEVMEQRGIPRPTFSGTELRNIIAYIESDQPNVVSTALYVLPGPTSSGARTFRDKGCVQCHAVGGVGGRVGPDLGTRRVYPSILAFAAAMWNEAPTMARAIKQRGGSVPRLAPSEMADVVGYLYSVNYFTQSGNAAHGRRHLREKGCLRCHPLAGRGGRSAADLATYAGLDSPAGVIAALWNHVLVGEDSSADSHTWPTFRPEEIADLTAFFQSPDR